MEPASSPVYEADPPSAPESVQREVTTTIGKNALIGHIDLTRNPGHRIISDWKFTTKSPSHMPASTYVRGWAYDLMGGDGSGHVELILLRRLKTPKVEVTSHFV